MPPITLVRPDGSIMESPEEHVAGYKALGYKEEPQAAYEARTGAAGNEAYYSTTAQKFATGLEGLASGLTLGASDYLLDKAGAEDFKTRAQYNPGTRLGTEIVGGILPAFVAPESLLAKTPAGLAMRAGEAAGDAVGGLAGKVVRGGVEGALFNAGAEVSHASLTGDPLTAESMLAGVGWGTVWGGGLSALTAGVGARVEAHVAAKRAAVERLAADGEAAAAVASEKWGAVRGAVDDAVTQTGKVVDEATAHVADTMGSSIHDRAAAAMQEAVDAKAGYMNEVLLKQGRGASSKAAAAEEAGGDFSASVKEQPSTVKAVEGRVGETPTSVEAPSPIDVKAAHNVAAKGFQKMMAEAKSRAPDWAKVAKLQEDFQSHLKAMEDLTGLAAPNMTPLSMDAATAAKSASDELVSLAAAKESLRNFPVTTDGFVALGKSKVDHLAGAVDTVMGAKSAELSSLKAGLKDAIGALDEHLGSGIVGSPGTQLRGMWETMKASAKAPAQAAAVSATKGVIPWLTKRAAGYAAANLAFPGASHVVHGAVALASSLLSLKGAVVGGITSSAEKWVPKGLRLATKVAPRVEPLLTRLDGTVDKGRKDRAELMAARAEEVRAAAPNIRDTLYKSIQGLDQYHPELAPAMFDTAVKQFTFLYDKLPTDPGSAFSQLKSLWKPDAAAMEKWGRYYRVFQDPVGVAKEMLDTGRVLPEYAEGLQAMSPAIYVHMRSEMLMRLSDPKVMAKTSYPDQVALSLLLDIPLHSSMTAKFIAPQMQMYTERNKPTSIPPQTTAGGTNGGRPTDSAAQKIGAH